MDITWSSYYITTLSSYLFPAEGHLLHVIKKKQHHLHSKHNSKNENIFVFIQRDGRYYWPHYFLTNNKHVITRHSQWAQVEVLVSVKAQPGNLVYGCTLLLCPPVYQEIVYTNFLPSLQMVVFMYQQTNQRFRFIFHLCPRLVGLLALLILSVAKLVLTPALFLTHRQSCRSFYPPAAEQHLFSDTMGYYGQITEHTVNTSHRDFFFGMKNTFM